MLILTRWLLWVNLIHKKRTVPLFFYYFHIFITMRKRHWKDRKNRKCPDCSRLIYYTRKDSFDRAIGNNTVCKSCAQLDRKLTMDTIEKMKQPKTIQHKKKISKSLRKWWDTKKNVEVTWDSAKQID